MILSVMVVLFSGFKFFFLVLKKLVGNFLLFDFEYVFLYLSFTSQTFQIFLVCVCSWRLKVKLNTRVGAPLCLIPKRALVFDLRAIAESARESFCALYKLNARYLDFIFLETSGFGIK